MDPFKPSKNKPGSLAWWGEMVRRFVGFMIQGVKEVFGLVSGKKR